jgi:metal-responsive CopG/Arc/MetJ family transcriptional regulator
MSIGPRKYFAYIAVMLYMSHMTEETTKILLNIDRSLVERINDFRFEHRIETRAEAIRRLIEESLERYERQEKKPKK